MYYNHISQEWSDTPGFPVFLENAISASPAIGDLDNDGKLEIAIATQGNNNIGIFLSLRIMEK